MERYHKLFRHSSTVMLRNPLLSRIAPLFAGGIDFEIPGYLRSLVCKTLRGTDCHLGLKMASRIDVSPRYRHLLFDETYLLRSSPLKAGTTMRLALLVSAIVFPIFAALAKDHSSAAQAQLPSEWVPSGEVMYRQFCAACHEVRGRGNGPAASKLRPVPRT